jgi:60 kDa SS-A/Ro ribonucleoprotein
LGTEGATFYQTEADYTKAETGFVRDFARDHGVQAVAIIREVALANRAPKPTPLLFALAVVAKTADLAGRKAAYAAMNDVVRTGTDLLRFVGFLQAFGGWGRLTRASIAKLYDELPLGKLALWAVKYRQRDGWSQRDVLRLAHPKTSDLERNHVLRFITTGAWDATATPETAVIEGFVRMQAATTTQQAAALMREYRLPLEAVPSELHGPACFEAALAGNGLTWLLRNLGNLGKHGLLVPGAWELVALLRQRLLDPHTLVAGRIHPIDVLKALLTYQTGHGVRGGNAWPVVPEVVAILDAAFVASFQAVEPTGKRFLLALDVSGSMTMGQVAGVAGLSPHLAATAMAMVTARREPQHHIMGFADQFRNLGIHSADSLQTALKKTSGMSFGATDCALPMLWATANKVKVDVFVVYTDNETWFGKVHPVKALAEYRQKLGIDARLVVVGMTAGPFTIADPTDGGMLDVVGFDAAAPRVMSEFALGRF